MVSVENYKADKMKVKSERKVKKMKVKVKEKCGIGRGLVW